MLYQSLHLLDFQLGDSIFLFAFLQLLLQLIESALFFFNAFVPLFEIFSVLLFLVFYFLFDGGSCGFKTFNLLLVNFGVFLLWRRGREASLNADIFNQAFVLFVVFSDLLKHVFLILLAFFLLFLLFLQLSDLIFPDSQFINESTQLLLILLLITKFFKCFSLLLLLNFHKFDF